MSSSRWKAHLLLFAVSALSWGCGDKEEASDGGGAGAADVDADGDGVTGGEGDCDDRNSSVYPGAEDASVDGVDQDCDGLDGPDADGDGFVDAAAGGDDCDDADDAVSPEATEVWYDGVDQDCDGASDYDSDGDGVDSAEHGGEDCDDAADTTYPGADEDYTDGLDQDCDGVADQADTTCASDLTLTLVDGTEMALDACRGWALDADYDYDIDDPPQLLSFELGFDASGDPAFDCSLTLAQSDVCGPGFYLQGDGVPGRTTLVTVDCSGVSADSEGTFSGEGYLELTDIDTGSAGGSFESTPLYVALEGRVSVALGATGMTLAGEFSVGTEQLGGPDGTAGDCAGSDGDEDDDGQLDVLYDGPDCDDGDAAVYLGAAAAEPSMCTRDGDGDGYGDATTTSPAEAGTDCDDAAAAAYPGAAAAEPSLCTRDGDGDGYGDATATAPLDAGTDCDDAAAAAYPGAATEEPSLCTRDGDGDGYGDSAATAPLDAGTDCDDADASLDPADADADGYSTCDEDCDDTDASLAPNDGDGDGYSSCDGDCDDSSFSTAPGAAEREDPVACMTDVDRDGWGDAAATVGVVGTDCNDSDYYTFPGSAPNDDATACMTDLDGDDWGSDAPSSGADVGTDCDDWQIRAHPGAAPNDDATACMLDADLDDWGSDSFDNPGTDCNDSNAGLTPEDNDIDGYSTCDGDCDDSDGSLNLDDDDRDGYDTCDGDCDDTDDTLSLDDLDSDGYSTCDGDCDDGDAYYHPSMTDRPLADYDCDGDFEAEFLLRADMIYTGRALSHLGSSLSSAGDTDGDGLDDMLIGARGDGSSLPGTVYLVTGADWAANARPHSTASISPASTTTGAASLSFVGENNGDYAGHSASAGDVDNDGLTDFLIGAPANRDIDYGAGKVYVVLGASIGSSTSISLASADYSFTGEGWYDYAGRFVAIAGDVDNDDHEDILVGAYGGEKAYLIHGSSLGSTAAWSLADADVVFEGEALNDHTAFEINRAGDLDGDGLDDIIMGSHLHNHGGGTGKAYVVLADGLGSGTYSLADAEHHFLAEDSGDYAGVSVDTAGDVDGDGTDDILIGAEGSDTAGWDAGKAYLVLNSSLVTGSVDLSTADYTFIGAQVLETAGTQVRAAGDLDADGLGDVFIGADSVNATAPGGVYVIVGADLGSTGTIDLSTVDHYFEGEVDNDETGSFMGLAGDVDGDGRSDLMVGAHAYSSAANRAGKVFLLFSEL